MKGHIPAPEGEAPAEPAQQELRPPIRTFASRSAWQAFLEALIAEKVDVTLVGSTRAGDIVRDADILHLYKRAGVARWLLGTESCDEATLARIRKGSTTTTDREAIRLLRRHDILSLATWVTGFAEETDGDYWRGLRQLLSYDPDQMWGDYKHQGLAVRHMAPWRVLLWQKVIEVVMQLRPRALWRLVAHRDPSIRAAQRWYYRMGRRVWPHEVWGFLFRDRRLKHGPTLAEFWGAPQEAEERAMASLTREECPVSGPRRTPAGAHLAERGGSRSDASVAA